MTTSRMESVRDSVVYVDFAQPRRDGPRHVAPGGSTVAALAQLIAEKAAPGTIDRDVDSICRLLRQRCRWSNQSLDELRQAATLAHSMRAGTSCGGWTDVRPATVSVRQPRGQK